MQLVQTFIRRALPWGVFTRMDCKFGLKTRGVRLLACETLLPNCGPLPQTSQRFAMITESPVGTHDHSVRIGVSIRNENHNKRAKRRSSKETPFQSPLRSK